MQFWWSLWLNETWIELTKTNQSQLQQSILISNSDTSCNLCLHWYFSHQVSSPYFLCFSLLHIQVHLYFMKSEPESTRISDANFMSTCERVDTFFSPTMWHHAGRPTTGHWTETIGINITSPQETDHYTLSTHK